MLEIAICDDDAIILKTLGKYFGKLNDATIKYDIYNSADTLYRYVEEQGTVYDVFILDIEMQGMNGLELAQKIREKDSNCLIIFLTNYSQYVFSVFEVITFDFLRKPLEYSEFENLIKKTPVYNFINDRLVDESAVLRPLSWHLILYVFRYFSRKWQKISDCECPDLIQNETPVRFLYGTQKNVRSDRAESSWHSN